MRIVDAEFVREFIRLTDDGYRKGWHERNGGNLTYRVRPEEVDIVRPACEGGWRYQRRVLKQCQEARKRAWILGRINA